MDWLHLTLGEVICRGCLTSWLWSALVLEEGSGVFVTVINSNDAAKNRNITPDGEIVWHEGAITSVVLKNHLPLEERTLWASTVHFFWLSNHNGLVFEEVEDGQFTDSIIFKTAFNDRLLGVTLESEYLFVELDVGGFKLLLDVGAEVISVGGLGEGLALGRLLAFEVGGWSLGDSVQGNLSVLCVSDLIEFHV